jgi:hypothetical protein
MEETMKSSYRSRTGHERYKVVHKNRNGAATARRKGALERLLEQRKAGVKPLNASTLNKLPQEEYMKAIEAGYIVLSEQDKKRMNKEIDTLQSLI